MASSVSFNPSLTTSAAGSFAVSSEGYIQGVALDDPAVRNTLAGGVVASTETLPMWGGVGISEIVPGLSTGPMSALGGAISRATTLTVPTTGQGSAGQLTGFSVFNQVHSAIVTPSNNVPVMGSGMGVAFHRLGSGARITVAIDPALVSIEGYLITSLVSWDFVNQRLQPYDAATATYALTSMTYGATVASGGPGFTVVGAVPTLVGAVGDIVNISGATGNLSANGSFIVTVFTDNEHFIIAAPSAVTGSVTGSPVINAGTGALNVKVLDVNIGNSMTVTWDPVNLVANWNRSGSAALIQI